MMTELDGKAREYIDGVFSRFGDGGKGLFCPCGEAADIWDYLGRQYARGKQIVLYGMGNGADKIVRCLALRGIEVADYFASDGFVRGHEYRGKRVLTFAEACEKRSCENMIVLLAFASSRPEVLALFDAVAEKCETYAPDVPVCGEKLFDYSFFAENFDDITAARALLADDESRAVFDAVVAYKLSGRTDILRSAESGEREAYENILCAERFGTAADLGAYNGDSIRELRQYARGLRRVVAFEPDARNYKKLVQYADTVNEEGDMRIDAYALAAWSTGGEKTFFGSGNRNAAIGGATAGGELHLGTVVNVETAALDSVVLGGGDAFFEDLDYVKYDVEGAEAQALRGSEKCIARYRPALLVSAYHRSEDVFALPLAVHSLCLEYRLYLRKMRGVPAWDINLYAVEK